MRNILIVLLLFTSLLGKSQAFDYDNGWAFNLSYVPYMNVYADAVLQLDAENIDAFNYITTSATVQYIDGTTVVVDDDSDVKIGNYVKFGTSDDLYVISDTLNSSDSLVLNQSFSGSVGDAFLTAHLATWDDLSDSTNDMLQATETRQPWVITEQGYDMISFNGIDNLMESSTDRVSAGDSSYSINMVFRFNSTKINQYFLNSVQTLPDRFNLYISSGSNFQNYRYDVNGAFSQKIIDSWESDVWYHYTLVYDAEKDSLYNYLSTNLETSFEVEFTGSKFLNMRLGAYSTSLHFGHMDVRYINVYPKVLTIDEIESLYNSQKIAPISYTTMFEDGVLNEYGVLTGTIE